MNLSCSSMIGKWPLCSKKTSFESGSVAWMLLLLETSVLLPVLSLRLVGVTILRWLIAHRLVSF